MTEQNEERLAAQAMEERAYEKAVRLLRPLADRNSEYALLSLGWIYETGAAGVSDKDAARTFYEQAASQGSATAYLYLGWLLLKSGEELKAQTAFERGAQLNNDECKSELARLGDDVNEKLARKALEEQDYEEAVSLLRSLAESNSKFALLSLGFIYETGVTGAPDKVAARSYYERAASQGSATAYFELGRLLKRQGEEVPARAAFEAGAERGHLPSMSRLGRMMVEGCGGPTDVKAGIEWLERAAAEGHLFAQRTLLGIEERNAKSVREKLSVKWKIALLALRGAKDMSKDPSSDQLR